MFDTIGGLPVHPLVVHATVMFIVLTAVGVIALALRPGWRHKYGYLLIGCAWLSVITAWIAVESGNILTQYPGLGATPHAEGGTLLLILLVPFAILVTIMVLLDKRWHWNVNKHGDVFREDRHQPFILSFICTLAMVASLIIVGQTAIVGHSGAQASWGDVNLDKFLDKQEQKAPTPPQLITGNLVVIGR